MKHLEKYIKADARVLSTRAAASDKLTITFKTEKGDKLQGSISVNTDETVMAGDQIIIEYFQTEDTEFVNISSITVKPRQCGVLIEHNKRKLPGFDSKRFRIRRNRNIRPGGSGYKCLFTDAGADGCIARTLYLLHDNSLVISYADGTVKAYNSAEKYIRTHQSELKAAGRYDAIRLLEDQLNLTG